MDDKRFRTEDDVARVKLGPQGVPGKPDVHQKNEIKDGDLPKTRRDDGHVK